MKGLSNMEQNSIGAVIGFVEASGQHGWDYLRQIDPTLPSLLLEQHLNDGILTSEMTFIEFGQEVGHITSKWNQQEIGKSNVDIKWNDSYDKFAEKSNKALDILEAKMIEAGMIPPDSKLER